MRGAAVDLLAHAHTHARARAHVYKQTPGAGYARPPTLARERDRLAALRKLLRLISENENVHRSLHRWRGRG